MSDERPAMPAIRAVLAAYRTTEAHITEEQITAAWAEYDEARDVAAELMSLGAERDLTAERDEAKSSREAAEAERDAERDWREQCLASGLAAEAEVWRLREAIENVLRWDWALTDDPADWPAARDAAVEHLRAALSPREDA